ncbi:30S ribosomal protein S6 [Flavobacteriales bacterium]|jgi:small subunit ribosomal protein S6|nr:30S ribosomal protein S6 [Flavobacteriales bacterium]
MNTYETVFIMNPVLSDDQIKETVKKFVDHIMANKGTITQEENWGLKKLKYTIQKKKTGFYYLIEFQADGKIINDLEVEFKRDERVIRWQTVKLEKFALEYAERRKKKMSTNIKAN